MNEFCKNWKLVVFLPFKTQSTYGEFGSCGGIHSLKRQPSRTNFSKFRNISKKIPTRSREVGSIIQPRHIKTMQCLENRKKKSYTQDATRSSLRQSHSITKHSFFTKIILICSLMTSAVHRLLDVLNFEYLF